MNLNISNLIVCVGYLRIIHDPGLRWKALKPRPRPQEIVLGNEAADLDSVVSAVALAYLRQSTLRTPSVLPLVAVPRADLELRGDVLAAFAIAFPARTTEDRSNGHDKDDDIDPACDLLFIDDPDIELNAWLSAPSDSRLVLTDHNRLTPSLAHLSPAVHAIFDHHKDEGLHVDASPRIIAPVGSTTSLIVEAWKEHQQDAKMDPDLARLMLCPIVLDTVGLKPDLGRCTQRDLDAAQFLLSQLSPSDTPVYPSNASPPLSASPTIISIFDRLQAAKFDCSNISSHGLLRRDYKEVRVSLDPDTSVTVGISSVTWHLQPWIAREPDGATSLMRTLADFATERHLDVLMVMLAFNHNEPKGFARELLVHIAPEGRLKNDHHAFIAKLEAENTDLVLRRSNILPCDPSGHLVSYHQLNTKTSRKLLLPAVENIIRFSLARM